MSLRKQVIVYKSEKAKCEASTSLNNPIFEPNQLRIMMTGERVPDAISPNSIIDQESCVGVDFSKIQSADFVPIKSNYLQQKKFVTNDTKPLNCHRVFESYDYADNFEFNKRREYSSVDVEMEVLKNPNGYDLIHSTLFETCLSVDFFQRNTPVQCNYEQFCLQQAQSLIPENVDKIEFTTVRVMPTTFYDLNMDTDPTIATQDEMKEIFNNNLVGNCVSSGSFDQDSLYQLFNLRSHCYMFGCETTSFIKRQMNKSALINTDNSFDMLLDLVPLSSFTSMSLADITNQRHPNNTAPRSALVTSIIKNSRFYNEEMTTEHEIYSLNCNRIDYHKHALLKYCKFNSQNDSQIMGYTRFDNTIFADRYFYYDESEFVGDYTENIFYGNVIVNNEEWRKELNIRDPSCPHITFSYVVPTKCMQTTNCTIASLIASQDFSFSELYKFDPESYAVILNHLLLGKSSMDLLQRDALNSFVDENRYAASLINLKKHQEFGARIPKFNTINHPIYTPGLNVRDFKCISNSYGIPHISDYFEWFYVTQIVVELSQQHMDMLHFEFENRPLDQIVNPHMKRMVEQMKNGHFGNTFIVYAMLPINNTLNKTMIPSLSKGKVGNTVDALRFPRGSSCDIAHKINQFDFASGVNNCHVNTINLNLAMESFLRTNVSRFSVDVVRLSNTTDILYLNPAFPLEPYYNDDIDGEEYFSFPTLDPSNRTSIKYENTLSEDISSMVSHMELNEQQQFADADMNFIDEPIEADFTRFEFEEEVAAVNNDTLEVSPYPFAGVEEISLMPVNQTVMPLPNLQRTQSQAVTFAVTTPRTHKIDHIVMPKSTLRQSDEEGLVTIGDKVFYNPTSSMMLFNKHANFHVRESYSRFFLPPQLTAKDLDRSSLNSRGVIDVQYSAHQCRELDLPFPNMFCRGEDINIRYLCHENGPVFDKLYSKSAAYTVHIRDVHMSKLSEKWKFMAIFTSIKPSQRLIAHDITHLIPRLYILKDVSPSSICHVNRRESSDIEIVGCFNALPSLYYARNNIYNIKYLPIGESSRFDRMYTQADELIRATDFLEFDQL